MILLLGGTSDTAPIADRLARCGHRVLVSRATETPLDVGTHPQIESRCGPLDDASLTDLIGCHGIRVIVDATHPYAVAIRARANRVALAMGIPCVSFVRPPVIAATEPGVEFARDHTSAAALAFAHGRPVLLTTGSSHLTPYADQSRRTSIPLIVRVLGNPQSLSECRKAGIPEPCVLTGRGPFSVAENRRQIRVYDIGALVTKDSGRAGGTLEKLNASRLENCEVVVVQRPEIASSRVFSDVEMLLASIAGMVDG